MLILLEAAVAGQLRIEIDPSARCDQSASLVDNPFV